MPRTRGRSPEEQTEIEKVANEVSHQGTPSQEWAEGLLAKQPEPGDQIKAAAEALAPPVSGGTISTNEGTPPVSQPHLPGLEKTRLQKRRELAKDIADERGHLMELDKANHTRRMEVVAKLDRVLEALQEEIVELEALATLPEPVQLVAGQSAADSPDAFYDAENK
jgi:hypothetical protein